MCSVLGIVASLLVLASSAASHTSSSDPQNIEAGYKLGFTPLKTPWTDKVGTNPWPEYPRPRLQRSAWKNLNGVWRYRNADDNALSNPPFGETLEKLVLVPACLESALSGNILNDNQVCIVLK